MKKIKEKMRRRSSAIRLKEAQPRSFEVLTDVMPTLLYVIPFPLAETSHWIDRIIITGRYCLWLLSLQILRQLAAIRRGVRHRDSCVQTPKKRRIKFHQSIPLLQHWFIYTAAAVKINAVRTEIMVWETQDDESVNIRRYKVLPDIVERDKKILANASISNCRFDRCSRFRRMSENR